MAMLAGSMAGAPKAESAAVAKANMVPMSLVCRTSDNLRPFFDREASRWEECWPLGNGRIGMMADGALGCETIVLN